MLLCSENSIYVKSLMEYYQVHKREFSVSKGCVVNQCKASSRLSSY